MIRKIAGSVNADRLELLNEHIYAIQRAASRLRVTHERVLEHPHLAKKFELSFAATDEPQADEDELALMEILTARFARLADLLTQKLMRLVDDLELNEPGTPLDRINRAEKRGWVERAAVLAHAREIRNRIVHEYAFDDILPEIFRGALRLTPDLLAACDKAMEYAQQLAKRRAAIEGNSP